MKRFRGCLSVFIVFFCGVFFGLALASGGLTKKLQEIIVGGPDKIVDVLSRKLKDELKLDADQAKMVEHIILDARIKLSGIRQQTAPQVDAALDEATDRVRQVLNPDQAKRFNEIVRAGREKWRADAINRPVDATPPPPATGGEIEAQRR